ncbi:glycosyltransferase family 4 protein [Luteolibacter pohnpeiensis]|uniref:Glycosyltransferase family 4 protein n=1 Tax=Luteolibacter pohnpeiensis TaxID=454153 RepID=A0A934S8N5_9BACT|nr:glycosyltransferase family 4 protein [Luteolibacter pohnpeiensis]MBK1883274.1 glycosyltransferase family 4 protein [Luteolibacter pohnpeiensis]
MKKLRVLIIAEAANPDLTSVALIGYSLSQALASRCDMHLVTESRNAESILAAGVSAEHFTAIDNPAQRIAFRMAKFLRGGNSLGWTIHSAFTTLAYPIFERKTWRRFAERLKNGEFDLVHRITPLSPTTPSFLADKLAKIQVPLILGPLNGGVPWPAGFDQVRRAEREWLGYCRDLYRLLPGVKTTRHNAAALILASRHTYQEVTNGHPDLETKAIWLPENAIDPERFPEISIDPPPPPDDRPLHVAFVGRLVPYKGADMLLEAAAPLIRNRQITLEIIGDGPQMNELQQIVDREKLADGVQLPGWVAHEEVRRHLTHAQIFAFPSVREFGGGVVLEAMAMGLTPVVLDYGGPAELIPDGCGIVIPIGDREAIINRFREALENLIGDPKAVHQMGLQAQRYVRNHFTWKAKARQIETIYYWVIADSPDPKPNLMLSPANETSEDGSISFQS